MPKQVRIRELAAWGLDANRYRPETAEMLKSVQHSQDTLSQRDEVAFTDPVVNTANAGVTEIMNRHSDRADLHAEMRGLVWELGIVDLRRLIAFQRRLVFDEMFPYPEIPSSDDWPALVDLSFGPPVPISYQIIACESSQFVWQSQNPNLQLRTSVECNHLPIQFHGGSPFFEVAKFNGRWFLRDGYHRAYHLLRAGVVHVPSVIVCARTMVELGSVQPWFFAEDELFGSRPPLVTDFLNDSLTVEYARPRLFKTIRVTVEESVEPAEESVEPALLPKNSGEGQ